MAPLKKSSVIRKTDSFLRSKSQPNKAEYRTASLSINVFFLDSSGGLIFEASRGITVREIKRDASSEIIIAIPI